MHRGVMQMLVRQDDLTEVSWLEESSVTLTDGQIRLRIEDFALTSNNISYALFGKKMRYWDFFPAPEGMGKLPVWGYGRIIESRVEGLEPGEKIYGFLPVSTEVVLIPGRISDGDFFDASPWRQGLPAIYNNYLRVSKQPDFSGPSGLLQPIYRPLFATSYLIEAMLDEQSDFGGDAIILSSASSRTAMTLAYLLRQRGGNQVRCIGLTSSANIAIVGESGLYDQLVAHEELERLEAQPCVYMDFAGSTTVRSAVHRHFGDRLQYSCAVGGSHWQEVGGASGLPGPKPLLFFAPAQAEKLAGEIGMGELQRRIDAALAAFLAWVMPGIALDRRIGSEAIEALYREVLDGRISPGAAAIARFSEE